MNVTQYHWTELFLPCPRHWQCQLSYRPSERNPTTELRGQGRGVEGLSMLTNMGTVCHFRFGK